MFVPRGDFGMFNKILAVSICTIIANSAMAQDATTQNTNAWIKGISAGLSLTDGNSNASNLNLNAKASHDAHGEIWRFEADYNYGDNKETPDSDRVETRNDFKILGDYRHIFDEVYFGGFGAELKHDEIADIDYRLSLSPSLGMFLIREDKMKFSVEAGPSYIFEEVGGITDDYLAPRMADRLEWQISDTAKLYQTAEVLFDVTNSDNYLINAELGIETTVTETISLVLTLKDSYDNTPAEGKENNDVSLVSGLKWTL